MSTLKEWLEEAAEEERIEAVVLGEMAGYGDYGSDAIPTYDACPKGKLMTWEEALPWITYEFDDGFGRVGCQSVYAWTSSKIITVYAYDGSTGVCSFPRNPTSGMPGMMGG